MDSARASEATDRVTFSYNANNDSETNTYLDPAAEGKPRGGAATDKSKILYGLEHLRHE
jgi:hypothetical protein